MGDLSMASTEQAVVKAETRKRKEIDPMEQLAENMDDMFLVTLEESLERLPELIYEDRKVERACIYVGW